MASSSRDQPQTPARLGAEDSDGGVWNVSYMFCDKFLRPRRKTSCTSTSLRLAQTALLFPDRARVARSSLLYTAAGCRVKDGVMNLPRLFTAKM